MGNEQIVIQTTGLSKEYKGVNALQGLNLQVDQHSIFGFLGPNGAGKSTAIKLLLGLIRSTGGRATIFGIAPFGSGAVLDVCGLQFLPHS